MAIPTQIGGYERQPSGWFIKISDGTGPYSTADGAIFTPATGGGAPYDGASTWADRGTGSAVGATKRITDIGPTEGTLMSWDGTYWRVTAPTCVLFDTTSVDGAQSGSAQIVKSHGPIPAGLLRAGRFFRVQGVMAKDGVTDAVTSAGLKLGTAGTTSDTIISTITAMAAGARSISHIQEWWVSSPTQLTNFGPQNALGYTGAGSGVTFPQTFNISSLDSNALYLSLFCTMAGTTTKPQSGQLRLEICP